jgi:hypothetical protein
MASSLTWIGHDCQVSEKPTRERPPTNDEVAARLRLLVASVERQANGAVSNSRQSIPNASVDITEVNPRRSDACRLSWIEMGGKELILYVGRGGCWERSRDVGGAAEIAEIVESVLAGRVTEIRAPGRSNVTATLADGTQKSSQVRSLGGILPIPFWRRLGRKVSYAPYQ